ncbi:MAG: hypothetical protein HKP61_10760 [Dactylosporangium sp.]|nr:hypothetical protein [Dactylosporangium sp.]NNJ61410.1 hypothetical protein [Dactylosporangium sp.]
MHWIYTVYATAPAVAYVLPVLLLAVWVRLWWVGRRARMWFVGLAPVVAILCLPAGALVGQRERALVCAPGQPECSGGHAVDVLLNGFAGLPVAVGLAVVTIGVELFLALRHRHRRRQDHPDGAVPSP